MRHGGGPRVHAVELCQTCLPPIPKHALSSVWHIIWCMQACNQGFGTFLGHAEPTRSCLVWKEVCISGELTGSPLMVSPPVSIAR